MNRIVKELTEATPERKPMGRPALESIDGKGVGLGNISRLQISRVVASLHAGNSEKAIALREELSEGCIRWIRRQELARIERALACVRLGLAHATDMIAEQERDAWEELLEKRA